MNNWRLLLLAIVAFFQPIASFTDRNLIDGRQQCCDRLSSAPLQDTRSSLYGTNRLGKTTSALRRLNDQDEIREDRRYELSQRDSIFSRPSTERPLVDIRGRVARQGPSEIARSSRVEYRLERLANSESRERLLDAHRREDTARSIRDRKTQDLTRRVVDRPSRDVLERRNDRVYTDSSRDRLFRDGYRTERFGNERLSENLFDSQREMPFRSVERRITLNREARRVLSRTKDVPSIETSDNMNNLQRFDRERLSVLRHESSVRPDTRRYSERNNERRDLYRNNEQRRSLSENTRLVDQIRDMRIRVNARGDNRENRLSTERIQERREQREDRRESRQQNKENIDHRASGDRMQMARRMTRETRNTNTQNERDVDARQEIRHDRMLRETRDENRVNLEQRLSDERIQMSQRNIRDSSKKNTQNVRDIDIRREIRHSERISRTTRDENRVNLEQRLSSERTQIELRNTRENRIMNAQNKRNIDDRREIRHNERMLRETREEIRDNIRDNLEQRLSRERTQVDRRDTRESRNTNTQNVYDRREIRNSERTSRNTRDERENHINNRLSLERAQVDKRNIREFRVINNLIARDDDRRIDSRRETSNHNRMSRETRDENRLTPDRRLSLERIQMETRNIREFRTVNTPNDKDIDNRREIRHIERSTEVRKEARVNPEHRISRERIQLDRRDIREFRNMDIVIRTVRDAESQREIRADARLHSENRENSNRRLSRERIQMERRNSLESNRQDIRYNERLSRETREELRENADRRLTRESRQVDRRNIRESRLNRVATRNERNLETDTESRREIRYNERLSGQIRGDQFISERRVESRSADVNDEQRHGVMMDRRARSDDRRNFREIRADPRLSRSADLQRRSEVIRSGVERSHKIENRERETIDKRSRNVEMTRNRERISSVMVGKLETENNFTVSNWHYILYTLQAAYLCAIFMQMLTPSRTEKPLKMNLRWLPVSSYYNPIKVD